jgi:hypothetical protein
MVNQELEHPLSKNLALIEFAKTRRVRSFGHETLLLVIMIGFLSVQMGSNRKRDSLKWTGKRSGHKGIVFH